MEGTMEREPLIGRLYEVQPNHYQFVRNTMLPYGTFGKRRNLRAACLWATVICWTIALAVMVLA
jgi:hypothetical protein